MHPLGFIQGACMPRRLKEDVGTQLDDEPGELDDKVTEHFVPRKARRRNGWWVFAVKREKGG